MGNKQSKEQKFDALRRRAETLINSREEGEEIGGLLQELNIHQVELEIQNEELREARVELERVKNKYYDLFEYAPAGYITLDEGDVIREVNYSFVNMIGIDKQYLQDSTFLRYIESRYKNLFYNQMKELKETGEQRSFEVELIKENGETFYAALLCRFERSWEQKDNRVWFTVTDISPQKKIETALHTTVSEKDFLMKELNHRVKNNLLIVSSLIRLKNSSLGDSVDLSDIEHQVDAIGLIHDMLTQNAEIEYINLNAYIQKLVTKSFVNSEKNVVFDNQIPDVSIETRTAIPLALIINEICTNSIKHGYSPETELHISIVLKTDSGANQYVLKVSNNGPPMPADLTISNTGTLGMWLITSLVEQIEGTLDLQGQPHPVYTIRFPMS